MSTSVVESLWSTLPRNAKTEISICLSREEDESAVGKIHTAELAAWDESYALKVDELLTRIKNFIFVDDDGQDLVDIAYLQEMKTNRNNILRKVNASKKELERLEKDTSKLLDSFNEAAISQLYRSLMMVEVTCSICGCIGAPATPKFPCYEMNNPQTGRPSCTSMICIMCAEHVTFTTSNVTTCNVCGTNYNGFACKTKSYSVNMVAIRIVDAYLATESRTYSDLFGGRCFGLLKCPYIYCNMKFATLNELHKHQCTTHEYM